MPSVVIERATRAAHRPLAVGVSMPPSFRPTWRGPVFPGLRRALASREVRREVAVVVLGSLATKALANLNLWTLIEFNYYVGLGRFTFPPQAPPLLLLPVGIVAALTRRWVAIAFAVYVALRFPYSVGMWSTYGTYRYGPLEWWELFNGPLSVVRQRVILFHLWEQVMVGSSLVATAWLVHKLQSARREATRLATTDALTGVPNRRQFREVLHDALTRPTTPLCVAFLDLDGFKRLNDSAGHEVGDAALILVAAILQEATERSETAARLGGDEFALLLRADAADAFVRMEQVRTTIHARAAARGWCLGASIGVVVTTAATATSIDCVLSQADALMYRVKRGGRNAVHVAAFDPSTAMASPATVPTAATGAAPSPRRRRRG